MTRKPLPALGLAALAVSLGVTAPLAANATDIVVATVNNTALPPGSAHGYLCRRSPLAKSILATSLSCPPAAGTLIIPPGIAETK